MTDVVRRTGLLSSLVALGSTIVTPALATEAGVTAESVPVPYDVVGPAMGFGAGEDQVRGVAALFTVSVSGAAGALRSVRVDLGGRTVPTRDFTARDGFEVYADTGAAGFDAQDYENGPVSTEFAYGRRTAEGAIPVTIAVDSAAALPGRYVVTVRPHAVWGPDRQFTAVLPARGVVTATATGPAAAVATAALTIDSEPPKPPSSANFRADRQPAGTPDAYVVQDEAVVTEPGRRIAFFNTADGTAEANVLLTQPAATGASRSFAIYDAPAAEARLPIGDGTGINASATVARNNQVSDVVYARAVDRAGNLSQAVPLRSSAAVGGSNPVTGPSAPLVWRRDGRRSIGSAEQDRTAIELITCEKPSNRPDLATAAVPVCDKANAAHFQTASHRLRVSQLEAGQPVADTGWLTVPGRNGLTTTAVDLSAFGGEGAVLRAEAVNLDPFGNASAPAAPFDLVKDFTGPVVTHVAMGRPPSQGDVVASSPGEQDLTMEAGQRAATGSVIVTFSEPVSRTKLTDRATAADLATLLLLRPAAGRKLPDGTTDDPRLPTWGEGARWRWLTPTSGRVTFGAPVPCCTSGPDLSSTERLKNTKWVTDLRPARSPEIGDIVVPSSAITDEGANAAVTTSTTIGVRVAMPVIAQTRDLATAPGGRTFTAAGSDENGPDGLLDAVDVSFDQPIAEGSVAGAAAGFRIEGSTQVVAGGMAVRVPSDDISNQRVPWDGPVADFASVPVDKASRVRPNTIRIEFASTMRTHEKPRVVYHGTALKSSGGVPIPSFSIDAVDAAPPAVVDVATVDKDGNGRLDTLVVVHSEALLDAAHGCDRYAVTGYQPASGALEWCAADGDTVSLSVAEKIDYDTGARPAAELQRPPSADVPQAVAPSAEPPVPLPDPPVTTPTAAPSPPPPPRPNGVPDLKPQDPCTKPPSPPPPGSAQEVQEQVKRPVCDVRDRPPIPPLPGDAAAVVGTVNSVAGTTRFVTTFRSTVLHNGVFDTSGNELSWWSAPAGTVRDSAPPVIVDRSTLDLDRNGHVDAVEVALSEPYASVSISAATFEVDGYRTAGVSPSLTPTAVWVELFESPRPDTDATPAVRYAGHGAAGGITDTSEAALPLATDRAPSAARDRAAPAMVRASAARSDRPGDVGDGTQVRVVFSEPVQEPGASAFEVTQAGRQWEATNVATVDGTGGRAFAVTIADAPGAGIDPYADSRVALTEPVSDASTPSNEAADALPIDVVGFPTAALALGGGTGVLSTSSLAVPTGAAGNAPVTAWLLAVGSAEAPADATDPRFVAQRPGMVTFPAQGRYTVRLWTANVNGDVSAPATASILVDTSAPRITSAGLYDSRGARVRLLADGRLVRVLATAAGDDAGQWPRSASQADYTPLTGAQAALVGPRTFNLQSQSSTREIAFPFARTARTVEYPAGTLLRVAGSSRPPAMVTYAADGSVRLQQFVSQAAVDSRRLRASWVVTVSSAAFGAWPKGPALAHRDGTLLRGADGALYVVSEGERRPIDRPTAAALHYDVRRAVAASAAELGKIPQGAPVDAHRHPVGTFVRADTGATYQIRRAGDGALVRSSVRSGILALHVAAADVVRAVAGDLALPTAGTVQLPAGWLVRDSRTGALYVADGAARRGFADAATVAGMGYSATAAAAVSPSDLTTTPVGPAVARRTVTVAVVVTDAADNAATAPVVLSALGSPWRRPSPAVYRKDQSR